MWSNEVEKNRKTDEEYDDDCVEKEFQLVKEKFDKDGEGSREAVGMGCYSIII